MNHKRTFRIQYHKKKKIQQKNKTKIPLISIFYCFFSFFRLPAGNKKKNFFYTGKFQIVSTQIKSVKPVKIPRHIFITFYSFQRLPGPGLAPGWTGAGRTGAGLTPVRTGAGLPGPGLTPGWTGAGRTGGGGGAGL